ncbi:unnamed protein product [Candida verbasci]|uniref:DUF3533 domain-containing protein n=1 Tax=Candida verbasci TaxID=1227364 RepID=A0A9W4TXU6_9ASCO|nr:unnamed protein product [Candida verbasci]
MAEHNEVKNNQISENSSALSNNTINEYEADEEAIAENAIEKEELPLQRTSTKVSFFNERFTAHRILLVWKFLKIYLIISIGCLSVFSIYWGSMYQRETRLKNLRMLVVIEDDQTIDSVPPLFGNQIKEVLETKEAKELGDWHIYNSTEFSKIAQRHNNNSIEQEVMRQIHHQNYWSSIYIKQSATYNLYNAIIDGDSSYNVSNSSILSYYETGRDIIATAQYVTPSIETIERMFLDRNNITQSLINIIGNIPNNQNSLQVLAQSLQFQFYDMRPSTSSVLIAPLQIGLLYMIIVTFFQFQFFADLHMGVVKVLKGKHYLMYRLFTSIFSYFIISLMFSLVTLAFQVDFTVTFGKSGFLVYWMVSFLTMTAVGTMNEIAALLLIPIYPPLLGFWLIFWVIINITPTFTPLALCPEFFRYGYALPLHNSYEISKVVFLNTWKGQFGRNIGIIIAWDVVLVVSQPFIIILFGKQMAKKMQKAAKKK